MSMAKGKNVVRIWLVGIAGLLVGAGAVAAFTLPGMGKFEKVKASSGVVTIPLAKVSDGKAHFFKVAEGGREIAFFVAKASDGTVKTAFDACDVCYREKKGYTQDGGFMLCKQCNKKFDTSRIGPHSTGGCNPSYLPSTQTGGNLLINVSDLRTGTRFF